MPAAHLRRNQPAPKPYKGIAMEGPIAKWYTKVRERDQELGTVVRQVNEILPAGGRILEVAPGPGSLAIELARIGSIKSSDWTSVSHLSKLRRPRPKKQVSPLTSVTATRPTCHLTPVRLI